MSQSRSSFSLGWVFVSYFMIAGGLILMAALLGYLELGSEAAAYAFYFLGAALGGFFAGRASPGNTVLEPALGGVLLVVSFILLILTVPGVHVFLRLAGDEATQGAILVGLLTGGGGACGAFVGERTSSPTRSDSAIRWMGLSSLITLGALFFVFMVLAVLLLRHAAEGGSLNDDESGLVVILALAGSAFLGGAVTQAIAPRRMILASGTGFLLVVVAISGLAASAADGSASEDAIGGLAILAIGGFIVSVIGAALSFAVFKNRIAQSG